MRYNAGRNVGEGVTLLGVFIVALAVAIGIILYLSKQSGVRHGGNQDKAESHYSESSENRFYRDCFVPFDVSATVECIADEIETRRETYTDHHDLNAQQDMELWARGMLWLAAATFVASAVGVVYVRNTLLESRRTSKAELRAYVMLDGIEPKEVKVTKADKPDARFFVRWKNAGQTPARRVRWDVNWKVFEGAFPSDFEFPASEDGGQSATIGPGQVSHDISQLIPSVDLSNVKFKDDWFLLMWGWIEYFDVFDKARRRTEFCVEVEVGGDDEGNRTYSFSTDTDHNGTDEECLKKPLTKA